jgi:hypothetical protein
MDAHRPPSPRDSRRGSGRRLGRLPLLALTVLVLFVVYAGLTPWALHMGGRSTPSERWDGFGQLDASNGGTYVLFVHLEAGLQGNRVGSTGRGGFGGGRDLLHGTAQLCTEAGVTHSFTLTGTVHGWWTTDGARTRIDLTGGAPTRLPSGWVVALHGIWRGPALELTSPDNSFTEVFTPRGAIRHVTSTADAGAARVTLQYGSPAQFDAACRALESG